MRKLVTFISAITILIATKGFAQTSVSDINHTLIPYHADSLWGYATLDGTISIKPQFETASLFQFGIAQVKFNKENYVIDSKGEMTFKNTYRGLTILDSNLIRVSINLCDTGTGVVNAKGDIVIPTEYARIAYFKDRLIGVVRDSYYFFDKKGNLLTVKSGYDKTGLGNLISGFGETVYGDAVKVFRNGKTGALRYDGVEIIPPIYDFMSDYCSNQCIVVHKDGKWGVYDREGNLKIPVELDSIVQGNYAHGDCDGIIIAATKNKYGLLTRSGKRNTPMKYDEIRKIHPYGINYPLYFVRIGDKSGIIDSIGEFIVPLIMEIGKPELFELQQRSGQEFQVRADGMTGVMDLKKGLLLQPKYSSIGNFDNGKAQVWLNQKIGLIDTNWVEILAPKYDRINYLYDGTIQVHLDGKLGIIDANGKELAAPIYDQIGQYENGYANVEKGGKQGVIDKNGKEVIACKYDRLGQLENGLVPVFSNNTGNSSRPAYPGMNRIAGYVGINSQEYFSPKWAE